MTLREKIDCMEAFERGEKIQRAHVKFENWQYEYAPRWDWDTFNYRVMSIAKPKQTVTIEKWLCKDEDSYLIIEADSSFQQSHDYVKIKLLDTYEVEL